MKRVSATPDSATIQVTGSEMGTLMTALGLALGQLEPWPPDDLPSDVRADLKALSRAILDVLAEMSELAQIPFVPGETVTVSLALTGPVPDLVDGQRGVILSVRGEDETRDYPWCLVRLDDGRQIELPQGMLRHSESGLGA